MLVLYYRFNGYYWLICYLTIVDQFSWTNAIDDCSWQLKWTVQTRDNPRSMIGLDQNQFL